MTGIIGDAGQLDWTCFGVQSVLKTEFIAATKRKWGKKRIDIELERALRNHIMLMDKESNEETNGRS